MRDTPLPVQLGSALSGLAPPTHARLAAVTRMARPKVGHIEFLNCLPLYWGLVQSGALLDLELTRDTPDRLGEALVAGRLDVGPISLVELLRHADELAVLPGIAVGSDGPVLSVVLASAVPVEKIETVALGSTSRTSVLLARMLLEERFGLAPAYVTVPPDLPSMLRRADAAVVIGDIALRVTYEAERAGPGFPLQVVDLGAAWRDWSGLPMVFAVWAARREFASAHPGVVEQVHRAFRSSLALALRELEAVAAHAARWEGLAPAAFVRYFEALDFGLGPRQQDGLAAFARKAASRGEVPPFTGITFANV